jgi:hypothetical protein
VNGLNIHAVLAAVRDKVGDIVEYMIARATTIGHITRVNVSDEFIYRSDRDVSGWPSR